MKRIIIQIQILSPWNNSFGLILKRVISFNIGTLFLFLAVHGKSKLESILIKKKIKEHLLVMISFSFINIKLGIEEEGKMSSLVNSSRQLRVRNNTHIVEFCFEFKLIKKIRKTLVKN